MTLNQFFCVPFGDKYKLFLNTVYENEEPLDVVWPIDNIIPREQCIRMLSSSQKKTTKIRSWNGYDSKTISWSYTGSSMKIYIRSKSITIVCPILSMSLSDRDKLPYNTFTFNAPERFIDEEDTRQYPSAKVYTYEPYLKRREEKTLEMKSLPPHIAKLVLADSISKNECCSITCEPITMENATVTICGHVFTKEALEKWLSLPSSKGECPVCKQKCF